MRISYTGLHGLLSGIDVWTNTVVILVMRLLLMKILAFDTLMTIYVVIKW